MFAFFTRFHLPALSGVALTAFLSVGPAAASDLDSYLNDIREQYGVPAIAAAVVKNGEVVEASAVGTRVMGRDLPVTIDDRFHIGSNTKSMTATLAGMMVDEGKLQWDTTVGEVLGEDVPGMSGSLSNATLEQLLSHSSGIPGDNDELLDLYFNAETFDYNTFDRRLRVLDHWKENEITVPEGSPFQYSNMGYMIAGAMIEKVSGEAWERLIHERIFEPLGMDSAGIGPPATFGLLDAAVGHMTNADGSVTPRLWGPAADGPVVLGPAGMAHMSILDYAKWADWNAGKGARGPALVSPETLATIQAQHVETPVRENPPPGTPTTGGYGFGWSIVDYDWADGPLPTHNGSNAMNLTRIIVDPDRDLGVVVTTNIAGANGNDATGAVLERLYTAYAAD
ncbi:serine hydrolase domain-containing protein [Chachezhania antarctica]|uniref:serine hydrolase domain-containing protein n=1 Tax=Chachezhania antarctica TaxID=2340860 RepID=UPI000EB17A2F|nr:serine hydrolase domain-containing protein [Chachezhania antarctica]|tara:strand:+ start:14541 stop:15728 length:1188 start_codon:yes stop_codon:yes gene_type:complete